MSLTAISVHDSTGHAILSEILGVEQNWRRIKEAILIRSTPNSANTISTDPGVHINPSWNTVLPSQS